MLMLLDISEICSMIQRFNWESSSEKVNWTGQQIQLKKQQAVENNLSAYVSTKYLLI